MEARSADLGFFYYIEVFTTFITNKLTSIPPQMVYVSVVRERADLVVLSLKFSVHREVTADRGGRDV
jgi:hypothetical protein